MTGELLRLRTHEHAALQAALAEILSPGAHATLDGWRAAVLATVARATGADWGAFIIKAPSIVQSFSPHEPRVVDYLPASERWDTKLRLWNRQLELSVWSRAALWGSHLREMMRSSYYIDLVRPLHAYDTIGLTVQERHAPVSSLHMLHGSATGLRFGSKGLAILGLLQPAFRVAMSAATDHFGLQPAHSSSAPRIPHCVGSQPLTPRETECARLLAARRSNREIADQLGISPNTAKRHTESILAKLGLASRRDVERILAD